jgi:hypothetical protein
MRNLVRNSIVDIMCDWMHIQSTVRKSFLSPIWSCDLCFLIRTSLKALLIWQEMILDLEYLVLLHHFVGVWAVEMFALNILYYTYVYCVFIMSPDYAFTRISLQNRNCRFNNTLRHKTFQLIVSEAFKFY